MQNAYGIKHAHSVARRDIDAFAEPCADCHEYRVEPPGLFFRQKVGDLVIARDLDAHCLDLADLAHELGAGHAVGWNSEMNHAAGQGAGLVYLHCMTEPGQMIRSRKSRWAGADDKYLLTAGRSLDAELPVFPLRKVSEEPLDDVHADWRIYLAAIAGIFAWVIADPAVHRRQGIITNQNVPSLAIFSRPRQIEPSLDIFTCRARVVAGRQQIDINGTFRTNRACTALTRQVNLPRYVRQPANHGRTHDQFDGLPEELGSIIAPSL